MTLTKNKIIYILVLFLTTSGNLFSQRQYSISTGSDYTFTTSYADNGKLGFHINADVEFLINKHISITTGIGVKQLNFKMQGGIRTSQMTYFSGTNINNIYNDRQPFIIPGAVVIIGDSIYPVNPDPIVIDSLGLGSVHSYWDNHGTELSSYYPANYKLILLNLPVQFQINLLKDKLKLLSGISVSTIVSAKNKPDSKWIDPEATLFEEGDVSYNANSDFKSAFINVNIGARYQIFKKLYVGLEYEKSMINISKKYNSIYLNNISVKLSYILNK